MRTQERIQAITVPHNTTIRETMRAIDRGALGFAILCDEIDGRFVGLVSDGDLRRALLAGAGLENSVADVSRPKSVVASVDTPTQELMKLLGKHIQYVPLLNDNGKVVSVFKLDRQINIPVMEPYIGERELEYVSECILTGWVSSAGRFVTQFEELFANFCGTKYGVATSNGTTALHLALLALDIGPGDEVIVPSLSFIASANAITYTGATPVFVDSEFETWNIDPNQIEIAITSKTKAILPVHLYGHPANMDAIMEIAKRYNLYVIEDAAEAHGAEYKGKPVGSLGDIATFSFYGNKIITTGEGGMVVTNQVKLVDKIRILRDHGMSPNKRYWHPVLGYNYRITNLQAALGVAQMEKIEQILKAKRQIAQWYTELLTNIQGITLPPESSWAKNVYWLYSILIDENNFGMNRDSLMKRLKMQGIDSRPVFYPIHTQPIYSTGQELPVAEYLARNGLSLPSSVVLDRSDVDTIATVIKSASN